MTKIIQPRQYIQSFVEMFTYNGREYSLFAEIRTGSPSPYN